MRTLFLAMALALAPTADAQQASSWLLSCHASGSPRRFGQLGYWNLHGRLPTKRRRHGLYDVLPTPDRKALGPGFTPASRVARLETPTRALADWPTCVCLKSFRRECSVERCRRQFGTLEYFFGDLGLYDSDRPRSSSHGRRGARYHDWVR